jgi:hypothetical protein
MSTYFCYPAAVGVSDIQLPPTGNGNSFSSLVQKYKSDNDEYKFAANYGTSSPPGIDWLSDTSTIASLIPLPRLSTESDYVNVWRFGQSISQSRLGGRRGGSHACTIIALSVAEVLHRCDIRLPAMVPAQSCSPHSYFTRANAHRSTRTLLPIQSPVQQFDCPAVCSQSVPLTNALVNCMIDGNHIHEIAMHSRRATEINFTIPDALKACGNVFAELDFASVKGALWEELGSYMHDALTQWHKRHSRANMLPLRLCLLVIAYERSVLIVYQPATSTLGLIDSHSHASDGALMAYTHVQHLQHFTHWITRHIFPECWHDRQNAGNHEFEISALVHMGEWLQSQAAAPVTSHTVLNRGCMFDRKRQQRARPCEKSAADQNHLSVIVDCAVPSVSTPLKSDRNCAANSSIRAALGTIYSGNTTDP